ncbi:hypothetical protein A4X09_0g3493 [Tilletia walkeri]|uniref:Polysaccharide lyase 14 domain-containing protein n=1 Tax=Tilletia walkeri TaxID=117179 RepID=A0A8X7NB98_9BASI|nr:hypothetical protein A4X09_0g3493 [Tilletia walkeri]
MLKDNFSTGLVLALGLAVASTDHVVLANRNVNQAHLISSQPRQVSHSGLQSRLHRTAIQVRELLKKIEFVDLRPSNEETEKRSGDLQSEELEWAGVERRGPLEESPSPASEPRSIANTTFLIATTTDIAAEYGCDPQPWSWNFQPSPALAAGFQTNLNASAASLDPSATAITASTAAVATATDVNEGVALHLLGVRPAGDASALQNPGVQVDSASPETAVGSAQTDSDESPVLLGSNQPASVAAPAQNMSPLRRKLTNTRPRALRASQAETFPFDNHRDLPARRAKKAGYAVDKDQPTLDWLSTNLNLYQNQVSVGENNLRLAPDPLAPSASNSSDTILSVFYPQGSYAPSKSDPIGGASFYAQPFLGPNNAVQQQMTNSTNSTEQPHYRSTLVLQYSVAFPLNFDFVKGGKLPGLYSSVGLPSNGSNLIPAGQLDANTDACSGGARDGVGMTCWSARIMWRQGGMGEVYAYFPTDKIGQYDPCRTRAQSMICNDEYGTSIGRGTFEFVPGQYTNITLVVTLNSSPTIANGELSLWVNGQQVVDEPNMLWRTGTVGMRATGRGGGSGGEAFRVLKAKLAEEVTAPHKRDVANDTDVSQAGAEWVDKVFFSSFFGGSTPDYAATKDEEAYFKNFSLYSGTKYSSAPGISATQTASASRQMAPASLTSALMLMTAGIAVFTSLFA